MRLPGRVLALTSVAGALAVASSLALTSGGAVRAQTTPTPASSVGGPASVPVARFFGTVTSAGAQVPAGAVIAATIGSAPCGSSTTTIAGSYAIDVQANAGCTAAGAVINFSVNGKPANETGTVPPVSAAVMLNLTVSQATPTPTPAPASTTAPPPPPPPPPPARTATTAPPSPTRTPTLAPVVPSQPPRTGLGGASQQKPAAPVAQKPFAAPAVQLPKTGNGGIADSRRSLAALATLAAAMVLLGVAGVACARRRG